MVVAALLVVSTGAPADSKYGTTHVLLLYFRKFKFVRVSSLVQYLYNMYIVKRFEIVFSFNVHVYAINRNASVICQSECTCLYQTVNMEVSFVKSNENTYPEGRALMRIYRVVPHTKRGRF